MWKLAGFSDRDETCIQTCRQSPPKNKTSRFNSNHRINMIPYELFSQRVENNMESFGIRKQRRNVTKQNTGLRKIRNIAHQGSKIRQAIKFGFLASDAPLRNFDCRRH